MKDTKQASERLRVLQINKYYHPHIGGIERVVQQVAEGLAEETNMTVLVSAEDKKYHEELINGAKIIRLPRHIKFGSMPISFGLFGKLRKLSKEQDIIHLHMPFPIGDLACLLSGYKGKIVLWWHSDVVRQKKLMLLYKPVMLRMLKRADVIIAATQGHIDGSMYLKPFEAKCRIIPYGVEQSIETAADKYVAENKALQKNGEKTHPVRFLFVGRYAYYKGCDVLLEAFAKVKGAELVMAGSGGREEQLKQKAEVLGQVGKIRFTGKMSDEELRKEYADCDILVLPSTARSEAFGLVQIEAMAFGKPVINTKLPSGVPYVSIHGETGLTVEPGNVEQLAEAMQWMVDHKEERFRMGEQAKERMKAEYRLKNMMARMLELYRDLVKEQSNK